MTSDSLNSERSGTESTMINPGIPSNTQLAERMARVEEKLDHTTDVLERIDTSLNEEMDDIESRVEEIEPWSMRFRFLYRGGKWVVGLLAGSSAVGKVLGLF
ncbi:hypothetical protein [Haladaptatus sp. T7]|uniref:hypothetical protein n=1 Tax=Haladaptatus sp. T7 TaxID=2029368 RepID=UPI0021A25446|nr:hypothetical protein [Haladaptatus sp. T7]GKZ14886.1 hypothetical protein HAL_27670 [Haladaptatus sp. T7]